MKKNTHIEECIRESLEIYFKDLRGVEPAAMYEMILGVVEKPLLDVVMQHAGQNQSRAGRMAGHQPQHLASQAARSRISQMTKQAAHCATCYVSFWTP